MPSLKEVRTRISSVKSTEDHPPMKLVAAAKLRRAQGHYRRKTLCSVLGRGGC